MDGVGTTEPSPARGPGWRRDLALLALLLLLAAGVRAWVIGSTEVPARDSIGFIRYALLLQEHGWAKTVRNEHQHPGYPLTILAASWAMEHTAGLDCDTWQLSAQLASALAGLLLVVPMFYLGKYLFDRRIGFWGALAFQCLPVSGRALSDAISDPLFLLLLAASLALAVRALRDRSPAGFAWAGVFCGLAYLTRPEGVLMLPAGGLALALAQCVPAWRLPWGRSLACGAALTLAALAVGSPYYLTVGSLTTKPAMPVLFNKDLADDDEATSEARSPGPARLPAAGRAVAPALARAAAPAPAPAAGGRGAKADTPRPVAVPAPAAPAGGNASSPTGGEWLVGGTAFIKAHREKPLGQRMGEATYTLAYELILCCQWFGWLPGLIGMWCFWHRYRESPEVWVVAMLFLLDALLLWLLVVRAGYLSGRHVLVLLLCSIFQIVAVVREAPYWLAAWWRSLPGTAPGVRPLWRSPAAWSLVLLLLVAGTGLSRTLRPLHGNRAGHRAAGRWLAAHARPWDSIEDNHAWAYYYANRVFLEEHPPAPPPGSRPRVYVVVNRSNDKPSPTRSPPADESKLRRHGGQVVYSWPERSPVAEARVLVYRMP